MIQTKVLVISDHNGKEWASPLVERLAELDALAEHLEKADAVAVVLHRVPTKPQRFTLTFKQQDAGLADIQKALLKQIPVTPILGGCRRIDNISLQLPDSIKDLRFRIAVALPDPLRVPEVATQLIAAAIRTRSQSLSKTDPPGPSIQKDATSPYAIRSRWQQQHQADSVFISYRHEDTTHWAGELAKAISGMLGPHRIFFDVGSSSPGMDFPSLIDAAMVKSSIVVVVIGNTYFASGGDGQRRIDNKYDWVRTELRAAIALGKPLRVILVGSAVPPASNNLPDDIRALADATVVGTIRTGSEMSRILSGVLAGTKKGAMLKVGLAEPGGFMSGYRRDLGEAWTIAAVREGLNTLGWLLKKESLQAPQRLFQTCYPNYRFEVVGGERIVVLEEYTSKHWERRAVFSISGAGMGHTGVMKIEPRLVEAAVNPGAYLDRTGRKTLSAGKTEWPAGLDPLHYDLFERKLVPITIEAWNDTRQYIISAGCLKQPAKRQDFSLKEGATALAAFMPCADRIVTVRGINVEMIDLSNGERIPFPQQTKRRHWTAMEISRAGRLALGSSDGVISVFDEHRQPCFNISLPGKILRELTAAVKGGGLPNQILTLSWSFSEKHIVAATDSDVWIIELKTKSFTRFRYPLPREYLQSRHAGARFIGTTNNILIHAGMGDTWIIDAQTNEVKGRLEPTWLPTYEWKKNDVSDLDLMRHSLGIIKTAVPSPDGSIIALAGSNGQIAFVTPAPIMHVASVCAWHQPTTNAGNDVQAIAFHPGGKQLAVVASDACLIIGDVDQKKPVVYAPVDAPLAFTIPAIAWAPDGKRVALIRLLQENHLSVWTLENNDTAACRKSVP